MLKDYIQKEAILLNQSASSPKEAIYLCTKPLIESGIILPSYTEDILKGMEEYGPYFVIAPHIALPHARSEAGALKDAFGICTLKEPVTFGNAYNDPVQYLFPLSATSNENHMTFISAMAELLSDETFFTFLSMAKSPAEILHWFEQCTY